ncbi:tetratricopeptide repeat protein [Fulvimarina sp. MAC3]|uniref:tetratricopeptide repeat protein n=1 Tax=Fulvimarina sp. MAC3 TaxID=3148887 RepID=UPI0031FD3106
MARIEVCEKLSVVCVALFGVASASTLGFGTAALGVGAAGLAFPAVIQNLRRPQKPEPHSAMVKLQTVLEENFEAWASSGDIQNDQIAPMEAALAAVLSSLDPNPERLIAAGRNNEKLASLVVEEAAMTAAHDFAESADPQNAINRRALESLVMHALGLLDGDPAFEAKVVPWFQREVLADLDVLKDGQARIEAEVRRLADATEKQAGEFGIKEGMLIALARRYASSNPEDFDSALRGLEQALEVAHKERERGRLPSNLSEAVDSILARVDELNELGELVAAARALDTEITAHEEEDQRRKAEASRLYEKGVAQAILTRDAAPAAKYLLRNLDLETAEAERFDALRRLQEEWYVRGRDKGLNFDLEVSIELARLSVDEGAHPDQRGAALNNLAISLLTLGGRENGTERLDKAVTACRAALEEQTRDRVPLDWAKTQNNLGNALLRLGEREIGTEHLQEAVTAYRGSLEERTRERVPLDWAMTQSNLGTALSSLGERESGTGRLEEAVKAYRAALEERTRERFPLEWAATQNELGTALWRLGERKSGRGRLEEAVTAYRAALEERTRDRVPLDWAMTQNNLGNALSSLGERESGTGRLDEAVKAYRAALEEYTRDRVPLNWAATQNNLGIALQSLGERESGTGRLEEAVTAYRAALEERTRDRVPLDWAITRNNLGNALHALGKRESGTGRLEEAVTAYRAALEERTRDRVPLYWAQTRENMALAYRALYEKTEIGDDLTAAIEAVDDALSVYSADQTPFLFQKASALREQLLALRNGKS